ncbi:MAG: hypothetical protein R3B71_00995 [Candidatus Gracilibacteria bacterium]
MNRRIAMVIVPLLAVALYFSGCVGEIGDVPEAQTPTGCHKSEGRYYDPQVGKCLQAASPYEARRLNTYRYVNQLVEDGEVERAPFAIEFFKHSRSTAESLWVELHEQGATMLVFGGNFPTNQSYDGVGKENVLEELRASQNGGVSGPMWAAALGLENLSSHQQQRWRDAHQECRNHGGGRFPWSSTSTSRTPQGYSGRQRLPY